METSVVTEKGQIVIPSKIRKTYRIKPGTRVFFEKKGENNLVLWLLTDDYIDSLKGILKKGNVLELLAEEKKREREL